MGYEIVKITNENVKTVAQMADGKDSQKGNCNGELDASEISLLFEKGATNNCAKEELIAVASNVVSEDSKELKNGIAIYESIMAKKDAVSKRNADIEYLKQQISQLEKPIETKKKRKEEIYSTKGFCINNNAEASDWFVTLLTAFAMGNIGGGAGAIFASRANFKRKGLCALICGVVGAIAGSIVSNSLATKGKYDYYDDYEDRYYYANPVFIKKENYNPKDYEEKVNKNKADKYNTDSIQPLEDGLAELRSRLTEMEKQQ